MASRTMVIKQGWLKKSPTKRDGVQQLGNKHNRWFVLYRSFLEYWTDPTKTTRKGAIELLPSTVVDLVDTNSDSSASRSLYSFFIRNGSNLEVEIHAKTAIDCDNWVEALGRCVKSLKREDDSVFASSPERAIQCQDSLTHLYAADPDLELVQDIIDSESCVDLDDGRSTAADGVASPSDHSMASATKDAAISRPPADYLDYYQMASTAGEACPPLTGVFYMAAGRMGRSPRRASLSSAKPHRLVLQGTTLEIFKRTDGRSEERFDSLVMRVDMGDFIHATAPSAVLHQASTWGRASPSTASSDQLRHSLDLQFRGAKVSVVPADPHDDAQAVVLAGVLKRWRTNVCAATLTMHDSRQGVLLRNSSMFFLLSGRTLSYFPDNSEATKAKKTFIMPALMEVREPSQASGGSFAAKHPNSFDLVFAEETLSLAAGTEDSRARSLKDTLCCEKLWKNSFSAAESDATEVLYYNVELDSGPPGGRRANVDHGIIVDFFNPIRNPPRNLYQQHRRSLRVVYLRAHEEENRASKSFGDEEEEAERLSAYECGMRVNDIVVSVNGSEDIDDARDFARALKEKPGISLVVARLSSTTTRTSPSSLSSSHARNSPSSSPRHRLRFLGAHFDGADGKSADADDANEIAHNGNRRRLSVALAAPADAVEQDNGEVSDASSSGSCGYHEATASPVAKEVALAEETVDSAEREPEGHSDELCDDTVTEDARAAAAAAAAFPVAEAETVAMAESYKASCRPAQLEEQQEQKPVDEIEDDTSGMTSLQLFALSLRKEAQQAAVENEAASDTAAAQSSALPFGSRAHEVNQGRRRDEDAYTLPAGWQKSRQADTYRTYYFHTTGVTCWDLERVKMFEQSGFT